MALMYHRVETVLQDLHFGVRTLRRSPAFAVVAIGTLALGIGATTMVFSVTNALLFEVFPYHDADRLALFYIHELRQGGYNGPVSPRGPEFLQLRKSLHSFEDLIGFANANLLYDNGQGAQNVVAARVTTNTFPFLGVAPLMGRTIGLDDESAGAPPVCVVSYRFWQEQMRSDPNAVGATLKFDGEPRTLIGVMPPRFQFLGALVWLPYSLAASQRSYFEVLGRLRNGVSLRAATTELDAVYQRMAADYPEDFPDKRFTLSIRTFTDAAVGDFKRVLFTLFAAATMLLLIACSNVANLLLVRATAREREIGIRGAIGASRSRLVQQMLVESCILATAGGAAGCLLASYGLAAFTAMLPASTVPGEAVFGLDQTALWFALAVTAVTTLLCGLIPGLQAVRGQSIRPLARAATGRSGVRGALVVVEVALSIVLLVGAGLMTRTLFALTHVPIGINSANLLYAQLNAPRGSYSTAEAQKALVGTVLERIGQTPGVKAAVFALGFPPGGRGAPLFDIDIPGKPHRERWVACPAMSGAGYFQALGRSIESGRDFSEADIASGRHVVVINDQFARTYFAGESPLGRRIRFNFGRLRNAPDDPDFAVIGVVSDAKNRGLREPILPEANLPYTAFPGQGLGILVKTEVAPLSLVESLRRQVWNIDPRLVLTRIQTVEQSISENYAQPRFGLVSIAGFAGIGFVLAVVGVFSVMAYSVSMQTREIGIRLALGAQRAQILGMVLRKGLALAGAGIAIGLAASLAVTRLIASQLWGVSPNDPWTLAGVAAILAASTLLACLLPAHRATQVDPMMALRQE